MNTGVPAILARPMRLPPLTHLGVGSNMAGTPIASQAASKRPGWAALSGKPQAPIPTPQDLEVANLLPKQAGLPIGTLEMHLALARRVVEILYPEAELTKEAISMPRWMPRPSLPRFNLFRGAAAPHLPAEVPHAVAPAVPVHAPAAQPAVRTAVAPFEHVGPRGAVGTAAPAGPLPEGLLHVPVSMQAGHPAVHVPAPEAAPTVNLRGPETALAAPLSGAGSPASSAAAGSPPPSAAPAPPSSLLPWQGTSGNPIVRAGQTLGNLNPLGSVWHQTAGRAMPHWFNRGAEGVLNTGFNVATGKGGIQNLMQNRLPQALGYGAVASALPLAGAMSRGEDPSGQSRNIHLGDTLTSLQLPATVARWGANQVGYQPPPDSWASSILTPSEPRYADPASFIGANLRDMGSTINAGVGALTDPLMGMRIRHGAENVPEILDRSVSRVAAPAGGTPGISPEAEQGYRDLHSQHRQQAAELAAQQQQDPNAQHQIAAQNLIHTQIRNMESPDYVQALRPPPADAPVQAHQQHQASLARFMDQYRNIPVDQRTPQINKMADFALHHMATTAPTMALPRWQAAGGEGGSQEMMQEAATNPPGSVVAAIGPGLVQQSFNAGDAGGGSWEHPGTSGGDAGGGQFGITGQVQPGRQTIDNNQAANLWHGMGTWGRVALLAGLGLGVAGIFSSLFGGNNGVLGGWAPLLGAAGLAAAAGGVGYGMHRSGMGMGDLFSSSFGGHLQSFMRQRFGMGQQPQQDTTGTGGGAGVQAPVLQSHGAPEGPPPDDSGRGPPAGADAPQARGGPGPAASASRGGPPPVQFPVVPQGSLTTQNFLGITTGLSPSGISYAGQILSFLQGAVTNPQQQQMLAQQWPSAPPALRDMVTTALQAHPSDDRLAGQALAGRLRQGGFSTAEVSPQMIGVLRQIAR